MMVARRCEAKCSKGILAGKTDAMEIFSFQWYTAHAAHLIALHSPSSLRHIGTILLCATPFASDHCRNPFLTSPPHQLLSPLILLSLRHPQMRLIRQPRTRPPPTAKRDRPSLPKPKPMGNSKEQSNPELGEGAHRNMQDPDSPELSFANFA